MQAYDTQLENLVFQCFCSKGWLESEGFTHEPEQLRYAMDVAKWLMGEGSPIGLMEAETGIGKTLGYLIPLLLQSAITGKRGMVATNTVHLQNQMIRNGDLDVALAYVQDCGLAPPSIEQVIGARHYLNPSRLGALLSTIVPENEHQRYLDAAAHCMEEDGLIETFIRISDGLPAGVSPHSICIKSDDPASDNASYQVNKIAALDADVVITSHTMSIIDSYHPILARQDGPAIEYAVFDEADAFENAAEDFSSKKIWPSSVGKLLYELDSELSPKKRELAASITKHANDITALITRQCANTSGRKALLLEEQIALKELITDAIKAINTDKRTLLSFLRKKSEGFSERKKSVLDSLIEHFDFLGSFTDKDNSFSYMGVSLSDVKGIAALEIKSPKPGLVMKNRLMQEGEVATRVLLTSATLSDGAIGGFTSIRGCIGLRHSLFGDGERYKPTDFGDMRFVLADPSAPKPFTKGFDEKDNEFAVLCESWLAYTSSVIVKASLEGPTLVLTSSFAETSRLASALKGTSVIMHKAGESLKDKVQQFQNEKTILITPSAWEGVSIRDHNGGQLFHNLVITRIPIKPSDPFKEEVIIHYRKKGNPHLRDKQIKSWLWVARQDMAIRKLRQGFGRLIRKKTDSGCVWICDPRFPLPMKVGEPIHNYRRALPSRFVENYKNADVFLRSGQRVPITELMINDDELEEMLTWL
jgi:ATP-dependent DNA helicase DinG